MGYSPCWGHKRSDMIEQLILHIYMHIYMIYKCFLTLTVVVILQVLISCSSWPVIIFRILSGSYFWGSEAESRALL